MPEHADLCHRDLIPEYFPCAVSSEADGATEAGTAETAGNVDVQT